MHIWRNTKVRNIHARKPGLDGLGGEIALFELLKSIGKKPLIITPTDAGLLPLPGLERDIHVMNGDFALPAT